MVPAFLHSLESLLCKKSSSSKSNDNLYPSHTYFVFLYSTSATAINMNSVLAAFASCKALRKPRQAATIPLPKFLRCASTSRDLSPVSIQNALLLCKAEGLRSLLAKAEAKINHLQLRCANTEASSDNLRIAILSVISTAELERAKRFDVEDKPRRVEQ